MATLATLLVYANPYLFLTAEGEPMCAVPMDPAEHNPDNLFVGATRKAEITRRYPPGDARHNEQRTWFEFDHEPQRVPDTTYYRHCIARGELLAADEATALACGLDFADPEKVIADEKAKSVVRRKALHGDEPEKLVGHRFGPAQAAHAKAQAAAKAKADEDAQVEAEARKLADEARAAADKAKAAAERAHGTIPPPPMGGAHGGDQ